MLFKKNTNILDKEIIIGETKDFEITMDFEKYFITPYFNIRNKEDSNEFNLKVAIEKAEIVEASGTKKELNFLEKLELMEFLNSKSTFNEYKGLTNYLAIIWIWNKYSTLRVDPMLDMPDYTEIYDLDTIEEIVGCKLRHLYGLSNKISTRYYETKIPKRDGTYRELSIPKSELKEVQKRILYRILSKAKISDYATAYRDGSNIKVNASLHVNKKIILKLDIKRFFDSIKYFDVKNCFRELGFSSKASTLFAILCYKVNKLPQGAPTSPILTNIIMREFDERIGMFCNELGINYSRYSDDMTFSGDFDTSIVISKVKEELKIRGLYLNPEKTRILKDGTRKEVTNITVNEKLNVSKAYLKEIRKVAYYIEKYGVINHLNRIKDDSEPLKYLFSIR